MLRSINDIFAYPIEAIDGHIGKVDDCLFDDRHWRLRYIVVDTGKWLPGRKTLISPLHAKQPEYGWQGRHFPIALSKDEIRDAPELSEDAPVSAQYEEEFARYYQQYQPYWAGPYAWGVAEDPIYFAQTPPLENSEAVRQARDFSLRKIERSHLRSAREIMGYHIDAKDDSFGHVEDFIMEDETWKLQYLVIDPRNWLPGKKRLIDIGWVDSFDWNAQTAQVGLTRKQIHAAPEFHSREPINRDYESRLYDYYGRPAHWEEPHVTAPPQL